VDNCKEKMNPTQSLALQAVCHNCDPRRKPLFQWRLYEVVSSYTDAMDGNNTSQSSESGMESFKILSIRFMKEIYFYQMKPFLTKCLTQ